MLFVKQKHPFTGVLLNSCFEICGLGQLKYLWWTLFLVALEDVRFHHYFLEDVHFTFIFLQISVQAFANLPS